MPESEYGINRWVFNRLFIEKENSQFPYRILIHFVLLITIFSIFSFLHPLFKLRTLVHRARMHVGHETHDYRYS